ncbi:MAG: glycosyltransferase family 4 protein [Bacteroidales bacterium]|nr:glycosyltransferase family 4 protein [Bacteroidales bacterium]
MNTILFDNIIYSLQRTGGISSQWAILQNGLSHNDAIDLIFLERKDAQNNIYRKCIDLPTEKIVRLRYNYPLTIDRYQNIIIQNIKPTIFHSSYYRCVDDNDIKSVVTVHDFTYEKYMSGLRRYIHCKQKYKAIEEADIVVCVSQNTRDDLLHYLPYIDKNKIQVVYNGVSEDFCKLNNVQRGDKLLYVGNRTKYKNFDFVIETLTGTKHHLDICGEPLSIKEKKYLNKKLGINRYTVYSNIDNQRLNELYNQARCLIYPSSYEGFGLPIVEAQKTGCPVIALNASSVPEVIGETPLLLKALNRTELLSAIKMVESPTFFENITEFGNENARKFTSKLMIDGYMEIYNSILS